jgi:dsDNA-specific endonuclease/ATPase MutS2
LKKNSEEEFKRIEEELKKTKEELKKTKEELKKNSEEELEKKAEEGYVRLDKKVDQLAKKEVLDNFSVFAKKIQDEVKLIHDVVSATIKVREH